MQKKILIADPSEPLIHAILNSPKAKSFLFESATNGSEALEKLKSFQPDLLIAELFLPETHTLELFQQYKHLEKPKKLPGLIVTSFFAFSQNYHSAIASGASSFLLKPFSLNELFSQIDSFFAGTLKPKIFIKKHATATHKTKVSNKKNPKQYIKFWGTRGSYSVSGSGYSSYGGNTPCLEVRSGDDLVIIDAGTGIRELGQQIIESSVKKIHLYISHTHWDHISGLPFFEPLYHADREIHIWAPIGFGITGQTLMKELFSLGLFPVEFKELKAEIHFHNLLEQRTTHAGSIQIDTHYACHPGISFVFKIRIGTFCFGYASDNEMLFGFTGDPKSIKANDPLLDGYQSLIHFFQGCSVLIHEAQYTQEEYAQHISWGHSSSANAAVLLKYCGAHEWIITHHDPTHRDSQLDALEKEHQKLLKRCKIKARVRMAHDNLLLEIPQNPEKG